MDTLAQELIYNSMLTQKEKIVDLTQQTKENEAKIDEQEDELSNLRTIIAMNGAMTDCM